MPQSLRSILGTSSRVRKPSRAKGTSSPRKASSTTATGNSPRKSRKDGEGDTTFDEKLEDIGTVRLLESEEEALRLRDVVQTMRYIRGHMLSPVPDRGLHSTREVELRNYRVSMPPVVTAGHLHAILDSPTRVERETADLIARGVIRRVRVGRRGAMGEGLIETTDLEAMIRDTSDLSRHSADRFSAFLRENPTAQTVPRGVLSDVQADELVRAGFLTSSLLSGTSTLNVRPEDRTTLTSIQRISRHASGSISAVGGRDAIHLAGGGSGAPSLTSSGGSSPGDLRIAVPGHGRHLKLSTAGIDWLREVLGKTRWGEGTENWLRERFEGGGLYGPRWKEFWGVRWEWVLGEAVGLGVVEVFETKSVGRGVRALG